MSDTNLGAFQQYPGLYPTLARKIISNAPYSKVEDVLNISSLTDRQKETLKASFMYFTVTVASSFDE